jgi:hypothetical protein
VLSERGSFMAVYDITDARRPNFVQLLPTGLSPEGVVAIPSRNLVVTADELSGTLSIFAGQSTLPLRQRPAAGRSRCDGPFGCALGLDANPLGAFAVPDNALPTEIYHVGLGLPRLRRCCRSMPVTGWRAGALRRRGHRARPLDPRVERLFGGFFLASEGTGSAASRT